MMAEPAEFKIVEASLANGSTVHVKRKNIEENIQVDACFFDQDYTVAAATGVSVWEGSWYFLHYAQQHAEDFTGKRVLELGSGTGLLGLCLAKGTGAHVMMTDVPAIVDEMLAMNIRDNSTSPNGSPLGSKAAWPHSAPVGDGAAACASLDWTVPLSSQSMQGADAADCDYLIGAETVWLKELIEPYVTTVTEILQRHRKHYEALRGGPMSCLMCYRNRGTDSSQSFATTAELLDCFRQHGCSVTVECEGEAKEAPGKLCTLFRIAIETKL
eukprot:m.139720 g.139720  ORF g.139720 m.139720 type:complete len:271 (+) comp16097_c0_seq1:1326-2138(+)